MSKWHDSLFLNNSHVNSIMNAIRHHDRGWIHFDKEPFLNDVTHEPYDFTQFPLLPKLALYKNGINEVEDLNPYAGLLCSLHYSSFLKNNTNNKVIHFLRHEDRKNF